MGSRVPSISPSRLSVTSVILPQFHRQLPSSVSLPQFSVSFRQPAPVSRQLPSSVSQPQFQFTHSDLVFSQLDLSPA